MPQSNFNPKAALLSIGAHIALLLLCLFIGYTLPANPTPTEEMGMEVNLGNSDDGSGDDQSMNAERPAYQPEDFQQAKPQEQAAELQKDITTNDYDIDAASIKSNPENNKTKHNQNKQNNTIAATQVKPKVLFPNQNGTGGNGAQTNKSGTSEGNGKGKGDKGFIGGTPSADNYSVIPGNGTGGIGHSFTDRTLVAKPKPDAEFIAGGKVIVHVTVNREGQIVAKNIKRAANAELGKIALKKIEEVRFSKSETAPPEQFGDITFVFKTRTHK
ncbi:MAG: hypothetical protein QM530_08420 [Phycisphaerales bacterium]|nr:hypothetical protein [Phycisphaerales bacterium]